MLRILRFFKNHWLITGISILSTILGVFIQLYQTQLMADIIDFGIPNLNMELIINTGLKMSLLAVVGFILGVVSTTLASLATNRVAYEIRSRVFEKIQRFSIRNASKYTTGSLITRLSTDVDFLQRTLNMGTRLMVRAPVMLISAVIVVANSDQRMAYIVLALVLFLSLSMSLVIVYGFPRFKKVQQSIDKVNQTVQEGLINIRLIKSFVREDYEDEKFHDASDRLKHTSMKAQQIFLLIDPLMMAALNIATLAIMLIGSYLVVYSQQLLLGDLLVFLNYMRFTLFAMMQITFMFSMFSRSRASVQRINEIMDEEIDIMSPKNPVEIKEPKGHIEFKDVDFKYYLDNEQYILKDINFEILPGEQLGIIGSTGSGKSTLANLLVRLIEPIDGEIIIDGTNINQLSLHDLRRMIGFVPQQSYLFTGSFQDNLKWGDQEANREDIIHAAKTASIYDFIEESPEGVDRMIAQGGSNLSGGQRQRLSIARALVKQPSILVLDDSTSALDAATEQQVNEAFATELVDTTIINIAQKISSVANADKILVLDNGRMVGYGNHDELLATNEIYQEIYQSQMRKED